MNRAKLVAAVAARTGQGRRQVGEALDAVLSEMAGAVSRGESVRLAGYLRLEVARDASGRGGVRARLGPKLGGGDA